MNKLYVVVRGDLPVGLQAAQACHALREFVDKYPELDRTWHTDSKTLVLLTAPTGPAVWSLAQTATEQGIPCALNFEPDLRGALTSIALSGDARKLVRALPLLGGTA